MKRTLLGVGLLVVLGLALAVLFPPRCVLEGTLVETPSGPQPVESLAVGARVLSQAPDGSFTEGRVSATAVAWRARWLRLTLDDGRVLEVTAGHPVATAAGFRPAGELAPGQVVLAREGGVALREVAVRYGLARVYDLTVEPHPNFVAAGVVVHNKRDRVGEQERGALADLQAILSAQQAYRASDRAYGRLACLAGPADCGFAAGTPPFLDPRLAQPGPRRGYEWTLVPGPAAQGSPDPGFSRFVVVATPARDAFAQRTFAADQSGRRCSTTGGTVPVKDGVLSSACRELP